MTPGSLPIPRSGISRTFAGWTRPGQLIDALSSYGDETGWTRGDLELRADWLSFLRQRPRLEALPRSAATWHQALPAATLRRRVVSFDPLPSTDWATTRVRTGWPPRAFHGTMREKTAAITLLQLASWGSTYVDRLLRSAARVGEEPWTALAERAAALREFVADHPSADMEPHVARVGFSAGRPWNLVAELARHSQQPLEELARGLVAPSPDLQERHFHLGVLGLVLQTTDLCRGSTQSRKPLGTSRRAGPNYVAEGVEIWYEAGGIWAHRLVTSRYAQLRAGMSDIGAGQISPDLVVSQGSSALVLECKYSDNANYFFRDGYHQATTYALELRELFETVHAIIVVPDGVVNRSSEIVTVFDGASISVLPAGSLRSVIEDWLDRDR